MITLALRPARLLHTLLQAPFTHGEDGIQSVPRGTRCSAVVDLNRATLNLLLRRPGRSSLACGFAAIYRIVHSPYGAGPEGHSRQPAPRRLARLFDPDRIKLLAFTHLGDARRTWPAAPRRPSTRSRRWPTLYWHDLGRRVMLMTLLGGLGTLLGPVVGAGIIVVTMQKEFATLGSWVIVVQGSAFVLCVLFLRKGVVGTLEDWLAARAERRRVADGGAPAPVAKAAHR
jgi:branched-chain amino acid transport system permease protein